VINSKRALTATTLMGVFGLGWLIMPAALGQYWRMAPGANLDYMGHRYGALLVGLGVTVWLGRKALNTQARRALMIGAFVSLVLTTALSLYGALALGLNAWPAFGVELALTVGMGLALLKPEPAA
jgi:FtsH-binding integral membrane protein